ncbi:hypothetical protein MYX75_11610, partial [Acidobacteria bacterium AH-259-A15]|nr:hypothetical protein [Acidobacteria bacterium AH-259-A15]
MRRILFVLLIILSGLNLGASSKPKPEEIIKRFAAKETEFREVWQKYTYNQHIVFQVINNFGAVSEQREMWV